MRSVWGMWLASTLVMGCELVGGDDAGPKIDRGQAADTGLVDMDAPDVGAMTNDRGIQSDAGMQPDSGLTQSMLRGRVVAITEDADERAMVDAEVYLKDGDLASDPVLSDLNGRFLLTTDWPAGMYALCARSQAVETCAAMPIELEGGFVYAGDIRVELGPDAVYGSVRLADGNPCVWRFPMFGVSVDAEVVLSGGAEEIKIRTNYNGEFTALTAGETDTITMRCEDAEVQTDAPRGQAIEMVVPNTAPVIEDVYTADDQGRLVQHQFEATPLRVQARVTDEDDEAPQFRWQASYGQAVEGDAEFARWTPPAAAGTHRVYVLARDGRGGYALGQAAVTVQSRRLFMGNVVDAEGAPLAGAEVTVNDEAMGVTNTQGAYQIEIQPNDGDERWTIAVRKPGFVAQVSVVNDLSGAHRTLLRACTRVPFDPGQDAELILESGGLPITVRLPANGIIAIDEAGPVPQRLDACVAVLEEGDPTPGRDWLRADDDDAWTAIAGRHHVFLDVVDPRDADRRYARQLDAEIVLGAGEGEPVEQPTVSALNTADGTWRTVGPGVEQGGGVMLILPRERRFVTLHPFPPTVGVVCLALHFDPQWFANGPYRVRAIIRGPRRSRVEDITVNAPETARHIIPVTAADSVRLQVFNRDGELLPEWTQPFSFAVSPSSRPLLGPVSLTANLAADCGSVNLPWRVSKPQSDFLTKKLSTGPNPAAETAAYYLAIDPNGDRITLGGFRTANGFNPPPAGDILGLQVTNDDAVAYYNSTADLGFGRQMHMKVTRNAGTNAVERLAMYTVNFRDANRSLAHDSPLNAVAMEWSADSPTGTPYTKFFVYDKFGDRIDRADLDGFGDKFVPGLCSNCHGGNWNPTGNPPIGNPNIGARFLPFDLDGLDYPDSTVTRPDNTVVAPLLRSDQEENFRKLNGVILSLGATTPQSMRDLIEGWYQADASDPFGVVFKPNGFNAADTDWMPAAWANSAHPDAQRVYRDVVTICRGCHLAHGYPSFAPPVVNQASNFPGTYNVCNLGNMPHAWEAFKNFWLSRDNTGIYRRNTLRDVYSIMGCDQP